ncbi:MAG TPA: hypothetical protein VM260_09980 [Pirellula sp.]|nr:hypothetical protein [Pirellula sp.]
MSASGLLSKRQSWSISGKGKLWTKSRDFFETLVVAIVKSAEWLRAGVFEAVGTSANG